MAARTRGFEPLHFTCRIVEQHAPGVAERAQDRGLGRPGLPVYACRATIFSASPTRLGSFQPDCLLRQLDTLQQKRLENHLEKALSDEKPSKIAISDNARSLFLTYLETRSTLTSSTMDE